jgi:hypothetical protein
MSVSVSLHTSLFSNPTSAITVPASRYSAASGIAEVNTGDTVTISPEGKIACQQLEENQTASVNSLLRNWKPWEILTYEQAQAKTQEYRTEHSRHLDIGTWAFGEYAEGMSMRTLVSTKFAMFEGKATTALARSMSQSAMESADIKINKLLQENNIVLSEDETLNISINDDGFISVRDGIDEAKKERIEEVLNEDKTLWRDLVFAHAFRRNADIQLHRGQGMESPYLTANAILKQDIETILQSEYGVSLDDFELNSCDLLNLRSPAHPGGAEFAIKSKTGNDALVESLYDEEFSLYESIIGVLRRESGAMGSAEFPSDATDFSYEFEIDFSYKNGVTVEKGVSDEAALSQIPEKLLERHLLNDDYSRMVNDYSITVSSSGIILDAQDFQEKDSSIGFGAENRSFKQWVMRGNFSSMSERSGTTQNGGYFNQLTLQQYVVDMQRLTKFNTGAEAEWGQITFGKAGGTTFSVAVK